MKILIKFNLRARKNAKKPSISGTNRQQKRKQWGEMLAGNNASFWKTVVFSDKLMLELNSKEKDLLRRPRKTRLNRRFFSRTTVFFLQKGWFGDVFDRMYGWIADSFKHKVDSDTSVKDILRPQKNFGIITKKNSEKIPVEYVLSIYHSNPRRLQLVVSKRGYPTKY